MTLEWIVSSSVLILVVLLLRKTLGRKISARLRYVLWLAVLLRLLVPVQLFALPVTTVRPVVQQVEEKTIYSIPVQRYPAAQAAEHGVHITEQGKVVDSNSMGYVRLEDDGQTVVRYLQKLSLSDVAEILWKAGIGVFAALLLGSNLRFWLRLRRMRRAEERIDCALPMYRAEGLPSPCLFGLLRPAIYLTAEAAENEAVRRHVLAHEMSHYRHGDHIWSLLRCAALAVHWWNPLVWLAVICSRRDGELACDERALTVLGEAQRAAYGETLLQLVTAKGKPCDLFSCATTMSGGKQSLRERIERIACKRKTLVRVAAAAIALALLATACSFGSVQQTDPPVGPSDSAPVVGQLPAPQEPAENAETPAQDPAPSDTDVPQEQPLPPMIDREKVDGDWVGAVYNAIAESGIFYAWVETAEGSETDYAISEHNGGNVKHIGLYLPTAFRWETADEAEWFALSRKEQGTILELGDWRGYEIQCASGSNLVRIRAEGADYWLRAIGNDPAVGNDDTLFDFLRLLIDDAASYAVWDVTADGDLDYEAAARVLCERVAERYRSVPDWVTWKPLDVQTFPVTNPVYDAYFGEEENFVCWIPFYVCLSDPMSASASYWQSGAGLGEVPHDISGLTYYEWSMTAVVKRNADGDWYIAERGTGGYTAQLPFHTYEATAQQLVDTYFLTEGFSHTYLMFHYIYNGGAEMIAQLNVLLAGRSAEDLQDFFGGFYRHIKTMEPFGQLSLAQVADLLDAPLRQYFAG